MEWKVVYYSEQSGSMPVKAYIESISIREQAKTMAFIGLLEEKGPNLPRPYADLLEDGIHELRRKIMFFKDHLNEKFKDPKFKKIYEEEKYLLELGLAITEAREKMGLSQRELAQKSQVTQQQISKIENGINCNMLTFIKVSSALGLDLTLSAY